jgi:hypothetical protein
MTTQMDFKPKGAGGDRITQAIAKIGDAEVRQAFVKLMKGPKAPRWIRSRARTAEIKGLLRRLFQIKLCPLIAPAGEINLQLRVMSLFSVGRASVGGA